MRKVLISLMFVMFLGLVSCEENACSLPSSLVGIWIGAYDSMICHASGKLEYSSDDSDETSHGERTWSVEERDGFQGNFFRTVENFSGNKYSMNLRSYSLFDDTLLLDVFSLQENSQLAKQWERVWYRQEVTNRYDPLVLEFCEEQVIEQIAIQGTAFTLKISQRYVARDYESGAELDRIFNTAHFSGDIEWQNGGTTFTVNITEANHGDCFYYILINVGDTLHGRYWKERDVFTLDGKYMEDEPLYKYVKN